MGKLGCKVDKKTGRSHKTKLYKTQVFTLHVGHSLHHPKMCSTVKWSKKRQSGLYSGLEMSLQGVTHLHPHTLDCLPAVWNSPPPIL